MQQPTSEETRNLILAGVLSLGVLILWEAMFGVSPPPPSEQTLSPETEISLTEETARPAPGATFLEHDAALAASQRVKIDTPRLSGSIALTGAVFDELLLKDYGVALGAGSDRVELLHPQLTDNAYFARFGWRAIGGVVAPSPQSEWLLAPGSEETLTPATPVTLTWDNGQGLVFLRKVEVDDRYLFTVTQTVENRSEQEVQLAPFSKIERHGVQQTSNYWVLHEGAIGVVNGALVMEDYSDLDDADPIAFAGAPQSAAEADLWRGQTDVAEQVGWLGFTDPYWLTAISPADGRPYRTMFASKTGRAGQPLYVTEAVHRPLTIAPGASASSSVRFFAGAKEVAALRDYQYKFDGGAAPAGTLGKVSDFFFYSSQSRFVDSVDWGWFFFLTKPIFEILASINAATGNMGVAIILLTLLFKTLLFPLAYKSYVSMAGMKKLQPEMKKIQERYGEDRMKMQQEMMALYKREKVNPAAGCLPILAQIPIFFSLYKVLVVSIELRHAPFFGWIQDLSAPDPTSILNVFGLMPWDAPDPESLLAIFSIGVWPVLMGVTMWFQQTLNPAPTDPMQEKIFNLLPIVFTFMLGIFASGLVIYWTANNVLTIIQQYTIMRSQGVDVEIISNLKRKLGLAPKESRG